MIEGSEFQIVDRMLTHDITVRLAQELVKLPELQSFTFEGNSIEDEAAVVALLSNLKSFDKLENLNVRSNQKWTSSVTSALCKGI